MSLRPGKELVKRALASRWGWSLAGPLVRAPGAIVLMYHRILGEDRTFHGLPVERFEAEMRWLAEHCEPISPAELVQCARAGRARRPAVLVTFDDGYRDYHELAYPVLKRLGIPALVFVATSFLDAGGMIWTDELQLALRSSTRAAVSRPWASGTACITDPTARRAWGEAAGRYLKRLPDHERRRALAQLVAELGSPSPVGRQMLSWDEVRRTLDITTYGGHTHTHPILSRVDRARAEREIATCRDRILAETGRAPTCFAYPNGQACDFTPETKDILRQNGFTLAFSTVEGVARRDSDWMAVKRLPGGAATLAEFVWVAAGLSRG